MRADRGVCVYDTAPAQLYACGWRCPEHTPAREAGRDEAPGPTARPWWVTADGHALPLSPLSTSSIHDSRAVTSGRRVSGARRRTAHQGEQYDRGES